MADIAWTKCCAKSHKRSISLSDQLTGLRQRQEKEERTTCKNCHLPTDSTCRFGGRPRTLRVRPVLKNLHENNT